MASPEAVSTLAALAGTGTGLGISLSRADLSLLPLQGSDLWLGVCTLFRMKILKIYIHLFIYVISISIAMMNMLLFIIRICNQFNINIILS